MGAKINLRYHIVLVAKYRKPALLGIEDSVLAAFKLERVAVEDGNHVHVVLRTTGTYSLSSTVSRLKSLTTRILWRSEPSSLRQHYWGKRKRIWSGGYYAATLGDVSVDQVEKYLKKQGHWK